MTDRMFAGAIHAATIIVVLLLIWILADVTVQGFPLLSWDYFTSAPERSGRAGGIFPILVSTLLILAVALLVSVPTGLGVAVWLAEFRRHSGGGRTIRLSLDVLAGVPSIVYGLFGNAFFCVYLEMGFSILSGGLTLACMILPIFIRTCEVGLAAVNDDWRKGASALGMTQASAIWHILLPAAGPAILAGLVLGAGRATAETAALVFTSGYVDRMPESLLDSGRALAVHIYDLAMNVTGGDQAAYAAGLTLLILIVAINVLAHVATHYWTQRRIMSP